MKRAFASLLGLSLLILSCQLFTPPATPPTPTPELALLEVAWDDYSIFKDGLVASQQDILNKLTKASIYHLEFTIGDDLVHVIGKEEVRYTNTEDAALNEVKFRLFPNILGGEMHVGEVLVDGKPIIPNYSLNDSLLTVPLTQPLEPNQSVVLSMDFTVSVPQSVELNYGMFVYYDNVLALAHAYPMICVYDEEGWNAEIPSPWGDITYNDASFYVVRIAAPKGVTLVTTGREVTRSEADQNQILIVASGPARDFYLAASPNFQVVSKKVGEVTINSYAPKEVQEGAQFALEVTARAIKVFSARYTSYPYTELDIVATPTLALGIEYPGAFAIANRIYAVNSEFNGVPMSLYLESTVAHEAGHQWFYNLVGNDQLDNHWLDESLTQFVTLQYFTDEYGASGADGFRNVLEDRWNRVDKAVIPIGLPVASYNDMEYGAIVYGRGPLFFEALKEKMQEPEGFDSFLKDYVALHSWGIATPEELQSLAERHCQCNLQPLFEEWVYP